MITKINFMIDAPDVDKITAGYQAKFLNGLSLQKALSTNSQLGGYETEGDLYIAEILILKAWIWAYTARVEGGEG